MKTYHVKVALTVFATIEVQAKSASKAEAAAEKKLCRVGDLILLPGSVSYPDMVFQGETTEVQSDE